MGTKMMLELLNELKTAIQEYQLAVANIQSIGTSPLLCLRLANRLTQADMAKMLGYGAPYVSKIENQHCPISKPMLVKLVKLIEDKVLIMPE